MRNGLIPITFAAALAASSAASLGCGGASAEDIQAAQSSGYRGDFAVIYSETLTAVRELYPQIVEDARTGVIRTAWHPVHVQQGSGDDEAQQAPSPGSPRSGIQTSSRMREEFFIRFDIHVVGGKPWRVRVRGEASSWKSGEIPTPLHGGDVPHWLEGRVNALEVAIYQRLKKYAVSVPGVTREAAAAETAAAPAAAAPLDVARFGKLPPEAGRIVAEVERAARARDVQALRARMADEFTFATGEAPSAETALVVWQADPSILAQLVKAVGAGCSLDASGKQAVCPSAATSGPRAVFQVSGAGWKMVAFTTD
jgi:hypothetical protein